MPLLEITFEDIKQVEVIIGLLATAGTAGYFFVKLYLEHQHMKRRFDLVEQSITLGQTMIEGLQERHDDRYTELLERMEATKKEEATNRQILASNLENQRLRDKEHVSAQVNKIFDNLTAITAGMAELHTSNKHILEALNKIQESRIKQEEINLKIYESLAKR